MTQTTYEFFEDAGHGWLKVSKSELEKLGILDKISEYSYVMGENLYLEEDCDMNLFLGTKKVLGEIFKIKNQYSMTSGVRNFQRWESVQK